MRDRLTFSVTFKDLEQIQTEHIRLEFIFKDSSQYSVYQSLQQQFQHLKDDLEKLQALENHSQQAASIANCHQALTALNSEQSTLHYPERFQQKLTQLESNLQHKIQTYTQELDDFEHRSKHLTAAKEAQKIREDLLKQSARYGESESSDRYETISTNIRLLIELFQISEVESTKTLEACQSQLEKLVQWKEKSDALVPFLQERFDSIREATEQSEARLLQRQQSDAERWLKTLENQTEELQHLTDEAEKIRLANKLLHKIEREQAQHIEKLNAVHQESLKAIEHQCETEIAKDCENQIKILFERIPRPRRVVFYRELEVLLSDPTEEFNG